MRLINTLKAYLAPAPSLPAIDCTPAPTGFPHIVRDNKTGLILMHGSADKCRNYITAFGGCHLDTV